MLVKTSRLYIFSEQKLIFQENGNNLYQKKLIFPNKSAVILC